jgi:hypothetical protein
MSLPSGCLEPDMPSSPAATMPADGFDCGSAMISGGGAEA